MRQVIEYPDGQTLIAIDWREVIFASLWANKLRLWTRYSTVPHEIKLPDSWSYGTVTEMLKDHWKRAI